jgi:hypothetical protein
MPEVSGLAGIINGPGTPPQQSPLEGFAMQLLQAKELQKRSAEETLQSAMKIAQYDPQAAEELAGPALKTIKSTTGKSPTEHLFQSIYDQTQAQNKQQSEQAQADLGRTQAQTQQAQAATAATNTSTQYDQLKMQAEAATQAAEGRLTANEYEDGDKGDLARKADARMVAIHRNLSPAEAAELGMTKAEYKDAQEMKKDAVLQSKIGVASALSDLQIQDPKAPGGYRNLNASEISSIVQGKIPANLTNNKAIHDKIIEQTSKIAANAEMMNAKSNKAKTDAEIDEMASVKLKNLAQAKALQEKGITVGLDDLLKVADTMQKMKAAGDKVPQELQDRMHDLIAKEMGGTPEIQDRMFGILKQNGWSFPQEPAEAAPSVNQKAPPPQDPRSAGQRYADKTKEIPGAIGTYGQNVLDSVNQAGQFLEDYVNTLAGGKKGP